MSVVKIILVPSDGGTPIDLPCKVGDSLMQAAVNANVDGIAADCGGMLSCATCHVYVREPFLAKLPELTSDEDSMLDFTAAPRRLTSRLSCQIKVTEALEGLTVDLPSTQH